MERDNAREQRGEQRAATGEESAVDDVLQGDSAAARRMGKSPAFGNTGAAQQPVIDPTSAALGITAAITTPHQADGNEQHTIIDERRNSSDIGRR